MTEAKRTKIKQRVAVAKTRNETRAEPALTDRAGETAREAKDKFIGFAKKHPIATVAGGLALGILVSGLFRGSPTRKIGAKVGQTVGSRTAGLAALGLELALAYAGKASEAAGEVRRAGGEGLDQLGNSLGKSARSLGDEAADYAANARDAARKTGKTITRALRSRLN